MNLRLILFIIALAIGLVLSGNERAKSGECPPPTQVAICEKTCRTDFDCSGIGKCCPTMCGGHICTHPVTEISKRKEKPGDCPSNPTGPWICTSTCNSDSNCRGRLKCCKNRCEAFTCQLPELLTNNLD